MWQFFIIAYIVHSLFFFFVSVIHILYLLFVISWNIIHLQLSFTMSVFNLITLNFSHVQKLNHSPHFVHVTIYNFLCVYSSTYNLPIVIFNTFVVNIYTWVKRGLRLLYNVRVFQSTLKAEDISIHFYFACLLNCFKHRARYISLGTV